MLFMVVERFEDPHKVYARFRDKGRQAPPDVQYVNSWIDATGTHCFQLMEADDVKSLMQWVAAWRDIVGFEIYPVVPSKDAAEVYSPSAGD